MKLWVDDREEHEKSHLVHFREASPGELLEAARPHADLEAAGRITRELTSLLPVEFEGSHDATLWTVNILTAALGADDVAAAKAEREEQG